MQDDAVKLGEQFSRLQAGLVMLSTYRAQYMVDCMESWRKIRTRELYQRGLELHTIKKSLVAVCSSMHIPVRAAPPDPRYTCIHTPRITHSLSFRRFLRGQSSDFSPDVQVEAIQFTTMLRLLNERISIQPDSATVLQERAFDIVVQADRFLAGPDLSKHQALLVRVCQDMLGGLCRCPSPSLLT